MSLPLTLDGISNVLTCSGVKEDSSQKLLSLLDVKCLSLTRAGLYLCKPLSLLENLLYVQSQVFYHACITLGMHDMQ